MAGRFAGKVVMITGAGGNLGRAVIQKFAAEGAKLALVDRSADKLKPFLDELKVSNRRYMIAPADLASEAEVDKMLGKFVKRFGQIDVLAHTVGGYAAGTAVHETGLDVWDKMMNLNARPIFIVGGRVAKHMVEKGVKGSIIFVLARNALKGAAKQGAYTASKAAAQRIMESMALELRDMEIHVNAVLPGTIDTPPNRESMPKADYSKWVQPEEIADAIVYLASEQASALYGVNLEVYGRS
jgi:NAD(P)-dependent dehydrogenase (short-subunit alcohol dehydrogenase family)